MQDQEIKDLMGDLETIGLSPTKEELLKELKELYSEALTISTQIQKTAHGKLNPSKTLTQEEGEEMIKTLQDLRHKVTCKRDFFKDKFIREGMEKIEELALVLGKEDNAYKAGSRTKIHPKKWYTAAIEEIQELADRKCSHTTFWYNSQETLKTIQKAVEDIKSSKAEREAKAKIWEEFQWCKTKLIETGKATEKMITSLSVTSVIELAHAVLKEEHSIENSLDESKCYCDAHDGNRHYHFADTYWDGKEVRVYTNSETY